MTDWLLFALRLQIIRINSNNKQ